ncbi:cupredoxin domain-containing protein [Sutcliffiella horikoshii]|uniref:cupredoxin domain-containing protein n=1 Tax=Sutcliffiella horikoshii TaxID=79883 RepID=UPI00384FD48A
MSIKKWVKRLVVVLAVVVVVTTLGSIDVIAESRVAIHPMERVNTIEVELNDDYFDPKVITIPSGASLTLVLKNKGNKEHTFTVEKLGVDEEVQPGEEKSIAVKPTRPGTYELICRYHLQQGMVGKVIVQ